MLIFYMSPSISTLSKWDTDVFVALALRPLCAIFAKKERNDLELPQNGQH